MARVVRAIRRQIKPSAKQYSRKGWTSTPEFGGGTGEGPLWPDQGNGHPGPDAEERVIRDYVKYGYSGLPH